MPVDITAQHRVGTVAGQHGVGAVRVVRAVRSRRGAHRGRALRRVHRLRRGRLRRRRRRRRRRGVVLLLDAGLETWPVVRVAPLLVLEPERSIVHAEHPGRLAKANAAVTYGVERAYKVLVRLRISRSFPLNRSLRAGARALAVTRALRRWRGAAARRRRRRVLQRPVGGVRIVRQGATGTSRAGTRVLIADGRGCCYFGRRERRRRLDRQIRLTRGQSETCRMICVLHYSPL